MKKILRLTALIPVFVAMLFVSCTKADIDTKKAEDHNFMMTFNAPDAIADAQVIQDMRLLTFYKGNANDSRFRKEVFGITRQGNTLSANVEAGEWYLAALSAPAGTTIIPPSPTLTMDNSPMYKYAPTISPVTNQSYEAAEIFFTNTPLPRPILASPAVNTPVDIAIARNVAMVELVISKSTATFKTDGKHDLKLYSVPSTISYTGALLPNKNNPDTLNQPLEAPLLLKTHKTEAGYLQSDTVRFIIPAHKGFDYTETDPTDVTTLKMLVSVDLERVNGTRFTKTKVLPVVAECNHILRVTITVDDGIEFGTDILPWNKVTFNETVGEKYKNWLYVKKGSTGNGQSWRDALPSITAAVEKVDKLRNAGYTVNGILVAGGSGVDKLYTEGINVPAGTRIFGGWEGKSGTELSETDPVTAPYTSTVRDLAKYKACLSLGTAGVLLDGAGSVLDGFCITNVSASTLVPAVKVSHSGAWLNAVEMLNLSVNTVDILQMTAGTATNILVSDCNKGVSLTGAATKLVNATIANNTGKVNCTGGATLQNSVVWWGDLATGGYDFTGGTVQYCAIQGDNEGNKLPTGSGYKDNVPVNETNKAWFTTGTNGNIPGPNFNAGDDTSRPYYSAGGNRAPMIARGDNDAFDNNTTAMPAGSKKDINGNPRTVTVNGEVRTDIGCYQESTGNLGFKLRWAATAIYVSSKNGYITDVPLLLPEENKETKIGLDWTVSLKSTKLDYCALEPASSSWPVDGKTTEGEYVLAGHFLLKTLPQTTGTLNTDRDAYNNYIGTAERFCGTVTISTNLGAYLPDVDINIIQTPGRSTVWYDGYVGSFHKNNETSERYISGANSGTWTVRVTSGLDWIKIDGKNKGYNDGVVEDTFGGVVSGTGPIRFRVGMKSTLEPGQAPRYGLITIVRAGTGIALFYVRQGEEPDYLYRPEDIRIVDNVVVSRSNAKKFSPYNVVAEEYYIYNGATVSNYDITGPNKGRLIDYPTKVGSYFQINKTVSYIPRVGVTPSLPGSPWSSWNSTREVCPPGYRHPTDPELVESLYRNRASNSSANTDAASADNFVWGRYADGYFEQVSTADGDKEVGVGYNRASYGVLMVNHYSMASIFFPASSVLSSYTGGTGTSKLDRNSLSLQTYAGTGGEYSTNDYYGGYCFYHTSTLRTTTGVCDNWHTHWVGLTTSATSGHIGMSCTPINHTTYGYRAAPVRCIKIE